MRENQQLAGSAARWGPLFGARARDWAETWEGPLGWEHGSTSMCSTGRRSGQARACSIADAAPAALTVPCGSPLSEARCAVGLAPGGMLHVSQ